MKQRLFTLLKLLITASLIAWMAHKLGPTKLQELWKNICHANPWLLLLGLFCLAVTLTLGIFRWKLLLKVQNIHLGFHQAAWLTATGMFFNAFLPGATGGDVYRAWYVTQAAPDRKAHAVLSIAVDRLIGMLGLFLLATIAILFNLQMLLAHPQTKAIALFVVGGLIGLVAFLALFTQRHRLTRLPGWERLWTLMPGKKLLAQLQESWLIYEKHPVALCIALFMSLGVHLLVVVCAWCVGLALQVKLASFPHYLVYCPIINAVASVPISLGGLGVRESGFSFFFSLQGVPDSQSVAISLLFYGVMLTLCLICGIFFIAGKPDQLSPAQGGRARRSMLDA
ncbi:MAG: lysylphosphatidylglycerol synthase transmembrane domain-containing protein [Verrucomicrobiae bacterium]|nr:lysylphosphatidylglycerol synthase transmembrane domain-containing protein [Verrucomicrobiae bacterium]